MMQILARLELIESSGFDLNSIDHFAVNTTEKSFQRETLERLGIPGQKVIQTQINPYIEAETMIVPSVSLPCPSPKSINFLRRKFLVQEQKIPSRIYISRRDSSRRRLLNEDEVIELLAEFGFRSYLLESMSVLQQASLLSSAQVVISPHGAGLTNIIFCNPGSKIVEIFSPQYVKNFYHILSNMFNLEYFYLVGEEIDKSSGVIHQDTIVNIQKLKSLIEQFQIC
ncbi:MAG: glycosyltransferase family 61 protein [Synechococcaceae cyanobacterium SM2_3_1]|nr:glycosyltransferase family 61 protein [Synechococcaceae cyanobacterium SM2_3_1]